MSDSQQTTLFRKKTLDRISSPEQLTDYLRVTTPGIWVVLVTIVLLLCGLFAWSVIGTLETTADATAIVSDHKAELILKDTGAGTVSQGMPFRIDKQEYSITGTDIDEYGRTNAYANVQLPDGTYDAVIILEQIHPISFLLESR